MVAKKPSPKATGTDITNYDEEMARRAKKGVKALSAISQGKFISIKGGIMTYNGAPVPGNALPIIILGYVLENKYYGARYDSDNPMPPVCYAFGTAPEDSDENTAGMAPNPADVDEPQAESCNDCEFNKFKSADNGKGKACKNGARVAVLAGDATEGDIASAEVAYVSVPVTSLGGFAAYVRTLENQSLLPLGVVTMMTLVPDAKVQFKLTFAADGDVEREHWPALFKKSDSVMEGIKFPYAKPSDEPAPAPVSSRARNKVAPNAAARNAMAGKTAPARGQR
jgi:hypothetical protein